MITYNIVQRGEPGVPGGGELKYYATANSTGEIGIYELSKLIEMISTVSDIDIAGVLRGFVKVVPLELAKGKIVRLEDFGYFRVSFSSTGHETEEEVSDKSITKRRILYTPGLIIKDTLDTLKFKKVNNGV